MYRNILLAVTMMATAGSVQAVTFTAANGAPDPGVKGTEKIVVDFEKPVASTGFGLAGGYQIVQGSTSSGAAPAGDTSHYLYVSSALTPNNATLTSPLGLKTVGFYWGSVDKYNTVEVLGSKNGMSKTLYSLSGAMMPPGNGDQSAAITNRRVTFVAGKGEAITGLRFVSTGVAFEVDDVATRTLASGSASAVPEPASWVLLVAGFGLVGVAVRRRSATTQVAA